MKLTTAKATVRALIRAINQIEQAAAEGYEYDSAFDGGEWSGHFHRPQAYAECVKRVLAKLGITAEQAVKALGAWMKIHPTPEPPAAYYAACYINMAFEQETSYIPS
jgi:hypothetical protein